MEKEVKSNLSQVEKPTYEQLENEVKGLKGMNNQLIMQLQQMNVQNLFKRMDYLFKVVENREGFRQEFVEKCAEELEGHLTLPDIQEESNTEE